MTQTSGGVKVRKIYGKLGRRIRAKERLEVYLINCETILTKNNKSLSDSEKKTKLSKEEKEYYIDNLHYSSILSDKVIPRIKKEIEILKSRI